MSISDFQKSPYLYLGMRLYVEGPRCEVLMSDKVFLV